MHQNEWLAVLEEIQNAYPAPSDFNQANEHNEFSYQYFVQSSAPLPEHARFTEGPSIDGKGQFSMINAKPLGPIPTLAPAPLQSHTLVLPKGMATAGTPKMESPANGASASTDGNKTM